MKRTKSVSKRPRFRHADQENQTRCVLSTHRSIWMKGYFDTLPLAVRRRLRESPFNLHPACLQTEFVPKVQFQAKQREHAVACGDPAFPENIGKPVALRTQLNEE